MWNKGGRMCCFFFSSRRRHTRWTGDWSSDVCSSDLEYEGLLARSGRIQHEAGILRGFVEEPGLDRDLLKDTAALKKVVASVKKTLTTIYPKAAMDLEIVPDEEHASNRVAC